MFLCVPTYGCPSRPAAPNDAVAGLPSSGAYPLYDWLVVCAGSVSVCFACWGAGA